MSASTLSAMIVDSDGTRYGDPITVAPDQLGQLQAEIDAATDGALSVEPVEPVEPAEPVEPGLSITALQVAKLQAEYRDAAASADRAWTRARARHFRGGTRSNAMSLERTADEIASQLRALGIEVQS